MISLILIAPYKRVDIQRLSWHYKWYNFNEKKLIKLVKYNN